MTTTEEQGPRYCIDCGNTFYPGDDDPACAGCSTAYADLEREREAVALLREALKSADANLHLALRRVEIANQEGDTILSGWKEDAWSSRASITTALAATEPPPTA